MKCFPKKYDPKDLRNRSKLYREKNHQEENDPNTIYSPNILINSKKISYRNFFEIYLKDFFNHLNQQNQEPDILEKKIYNQLFIIYGNQLDNIYSSYDFFSKKKQGLLQVGSNKLEKYITSSTRKYTKTNYKILDYYLSSDHKIYMPDTDLYIYILEQIRSLWEKGKITNKSKIGYRSFNLQTSIPTEKILRKEEKSKYYVLKYFVGTKAEALPVLVENIDFCCGDVALLVHPKDKRYNKHIGKNAIIPLCNRQIPIIGDENVNISINNGIKRICPCFDEESIDLAKKYGLPTDIYVFDKKGLYTKYIHEKAFIGKKRDKYYNNIIEFMENIGNLAEIGEKTTKIPYLNETNEYLVPYKIEQININLKEEKQKIINEIIENNIKYPSLKSKILESNKEDYINEDFTTGINEDEIIQNLDSENDTTDKINKKTNNELDDILPESIIFNSQIIFGRKIPFIKNPDGTLDFFDLEKECLNRKLKPIQFCFDFILLSLIRIGVFSIKNNGDDNFKLCENDKFYRILSENEKKINYLIKHLQTIKGKDFECDDFLKIIENISKENSSNNKDLSKLIENCKFLKQEGNRLLTNIKGITNDVIDPDFIELCIPCYLENKGIKITNYAVFDKDEKNKILKGLLIQELLLGKVITNNLLEYSYNKNDEFLGDKQLSKSQLEQSQRNILAFNGENPIRLNLLINQTLNQKDILLNNIFLKQIRNAIRLCIQKDFLPNDIEKCLNKYPKSFDDFEIIVLNNLKDMYNNRTNIKTYEEYIAFFNDFKKSTQDRFFSRYLEIAKINPTKNIQFVCSYFFNFLLTILYPLTPEFVDALQYISERHFIKPINPLNMDKTINYNINILYNTFIKIKEIKIECNIKQHEPCNLFIKSTPTIGNIFLENEAIFKNYFHISNISYLRLHEQNPLGYEIFDYDTLSIGIQAETGYINSKKDSIENIEKNIKAMEDKLQLIRERMQILPEGEQRKKTEEEYAKTKEEIENLTIKYSLLNGK